MALEKKTVPYETLVRHNPDGTISGAHYVERVVILDDGVEVSSVVGDPKPIPLDSPVFKQAEVIALNQVVVTNAALTDEQTAHDATKAELAVKSNKVAQLELENDLLKEVAATPIQAG